MSETVTEVVETGEKRDVRGRRMAPEVRRAAMLAAYEGSGLTMSAFARREGIKCGTFTGWVYKAQGKVAAKGPIRFAEVQVPVPHPPRAGGGEALEVKLPDGTVLRAGRVADLVMLVRALRT